MTDKKIELSTTMSTKLIDWNIKSQRVNKKADNAELINPFLDSFNAKILDAYSKLFIEGKLVNADVLKERIFGKVEKGNTLMQIVQEHNINFEKRIGIDYSYGSFKNYKTTKKYLEAFLQHQYKKNDISIADVKFSFCEHYFTFLTTCRPCNNNGANKHIQRLKKIVNYAYKMGYVNNNALLSYSLKFNQFQQHKLTWEELGKLQSLKLSNPALIRVVNIFAR